MQEDQKTEEQKSTDSPPSQDPADIQEAIRRERLARTVLESKAGLKAGWVHEHFPGRAALPPTWKDHDSSPDHKAWVICREPPTPQRKDPEKPRLHLSAKQQRALRKTRKKTAEPQELVPHLLVTMGGSIQRDGKKWIQIAVSRRVGYPDWTDIKKIKSYLLGPDAHAYMVLPPETEQSSAGTVMHLFHCLDTENPNGQCLPDFTGGTGIV